MTAGSNSRTKFAHTASSRATALLLALMVSLLLGPLPASPVTPVASPAPLARQGAHLDHQLHVVLFTPRNDAFWTLFAQITQAAAQDLGVRLEWMPALNDPQKQLRDALAVLARRRDKPDAIMLKNFDGTARQILAAAEKAGVYSLLFEEGFVGEDAVYMGHPREKFKHWLGNFIPDQFEAGYDLTKALIAEAKRRFPGQPLSMVAIAGNMIEGSSSQRVQGMFVALREHPEVLLHEIAAGYYQEDAARIKTQRLLEAYPGTQIVWAINDTMPVGAARAVDTLQAEGLLTARPLIGGCGTTPPAAADVFNRRVDISIGGHFLVSGFILNLLYDYFHGYDFAAESTDMRLQLFSFDHDNVQRYERAFNRRDGLNSWEQVDFRKFSKAYTPSLIKYPFGFQAILDQL